VLGILLLAVAGGKSSPNTTSTQASPSTPTLTLSNYCNAIKKRDYQTAYDQLSSSQQQQQTETQLAAVLTNVADCSVSDVSDTAGTGTVTYIASNGSKVIADEKLIKENGVWKMANEQTRSTPTLTLSRYCNALKQRDYQTAYNQLSNNQQQQETEAQFAANFNSPKLTNCTVSTVDDTAGTGTISYSFSNGAQVVADYKLVEEKNVWKIDSEQVRK
jgi:limonene-1,2-epoxide hydrolase